MGGVSGHFLRQSDGVRSVPDIAGKDLLGGVVSRPREEIEARYASAQWGDRPENPPHPGVNPKDLVGDTKVPTHLVPPALLLEAAKAIALGAKKYGPYNWRDYPIQAHAYYAAILRHLSAWWDGEDLDPESGENHLAHVAAGLSILLDSLRTGTLVDDRPQPGPAATIIREASA